MKLSKTLMLCVVDLVSKMQILVSEEISKARMDICKQCDQYLSGPLICNKCVCFLPAKTKLANTECPLQKWK
jgi:hypothetical protein